MSYLRKEYMGRLMMRCIVFVLCVYLALIEPKEFDLLDGKNFFRRISILHLLWFVWMGDMLSQLIPMQKLLPIGSQKLFRSRYQPASKSWDAKALRQYLRPVNRRALIIFLVWAALIAVIGVLYHAFGWPVRVLFVISAAFYVCDLICVLIWCPFRVFLKNRCCTTCRIFNWDHLMMFTPMIYIKGVFSATLLAAASFVFVVWEVMLRLHPERFWYRSNKALQCGACTDKLCTQYCEGRIF